MEAPFVERNLRLDYQHTNHLRDPAADASEIRAELSHSFNERLGVNFSVPFIFLNRLEDSSTSGFGDIEVGARYVLIGSETTATFKLAAGLNVATPTGNAGRDLGEGRTVLEPEVLAFQKLSERTFVQGQLSLGIGLGSGEQDRELGYSMGLGHVITTINNWQLFSYPTPTIEVNCATALAGEESGRSVIDLTPGLRWQVCNKGFAGVAYSFPVSGSREFDNQFIFSFVYIFGGDGPPATGYASSSRPYVR